MKKLILKPEQIIIPGEELKNKAILQIYFGMFDKCHGEDLPPVIVVHKDTSEMLLELRNLMSENSSTVGDNPRLYANYNQILKSAFDRGAEYFLLEGNHRSVAAGLARQEIYALELQEDRDIKKGKQLVETGELFNWQIPGESLHESMREFRHSLRDYLYNNVDKIGSKDIATFPITVKERVEQLVANGDIPKYMIDRYQRDK